VESGKHMRGDALIGGLELELLPTLLVSQLLVRRVWWKLSANWAFFKPSDGGNQHTHRIQLNGPVQMVPEIGVDDAGMQTESTQAPFPKLLG
jgi:hypothetical protein